MPEANNNDHQINPKAWLVLALSACFLFYKYVLQVSPAVMSDHLMQTFSLSGTSLGFLVGFYFYTYSIMQIPAGILLDRYSVVKQTAVAIFICACGTFLFSQTHSFIFACLARLLIGFGAAFATISYMKLASVWFPSRYFALLSGLFGTACMSGAGVAEAPLAWSVNLVGWRETLFFCAIVGFILTVVFLFFVRDKKSGNNTSSDNTKTSALSSLLTVLKNKGNWPLLFYSGLAFTPVSVFGGLWGVPFLMQAYHLPRTTAAFSASLVFFSFAIGGPMLGWLSNYARSRRQVIALGTGLALICCSLIIYVPNLPLWLLNLAIIGFGFGASSFLLSYAIGKDINSPALTATVIGVINMGDALFGALAEPLIGRFLDKGWDGKMLHHVRLFSTHDYRLSLSVLSAYLVLALLSCLFIREGSREGSSLTSET